jgi:tRNA A37 threonylcarbamoyladenosine dehydratase
MAQTVLPTEEIFERTELVLGSEAMKKLGESRVLIIGLGGVGGAVAEALARSGVGALDLVDSDTVAVSNLNRQLIATAETVGLSKTDAWAERLRSIHPALKLTLHPFFFLPETADRLHFAEYSYVADAVDTVSAKIEIVLRAKQAGVPVISAMGTGNKLDPSALEAADIYDTSVCPLARVMRRELRARGVKDLKVIYSREEPRKPRKNLFTESGKPVAGSTAFVPPAAGFLMASVIVRDLIGE